MKNFLKSFDVLSDSQIDEISNLSDLRTLQKDDFLIKEGKVSKEVAFVVSGIFRSFYYSSTSDQVTYCFSFPNTFVAAYSSFISGNNSNISIQALVKSEIIVIQKHDIDRLELSDPNWIKFFKILAEQEYVELEKRFFLIQKEKAELRYEKLINNNPKYIQEIPLNYLASYLGISQRHLSRLRASITI